MDLRCALRGDGEIEGEDGGRGSEGHTMSQFKFSFRDDAGMGISDRSTSSYPLCRPA